MAWRRPGDIIWTNAEMLLIRNNKLQWNLNQNPCIFIQEKAFENVCEMAANLYRPQCVKWLVQMQQTKPSSW